MRQADQVIVTSPNYLDSSDFLQPFREKCEVVPFGISPTKFTRTPEIDASVRKLRRRYGDRIILFAGILRYYKGLDYLIQAMEHVDARLLVVGEGPLLPEYIDKCRQLPHCDKILFLGRVESVIPYYYAADVFCLPSIYRSEAFGLVLVEAAACGLPLVSTELGTGTSYVNRHGETGLVVPPMDAPALAAALNRLLEDDALRRQYAQAARRRVETLFTQDEMCRRILRIYQEVLRK
jgi:rhamnosyl/mannosyltransferase